MTAAFTGVYSRRATKYASANKRLLKNPNVAPKPGNIRLKIQRAKNSKIEKTTASVMPSAALAWRVHDPYSPTSFLVRFAGKALSLPSTTQTRLINGRLLTLEPCNLRMRFRTVGDGCRPISLQLTERANHRPGPPEERRSQPGALMDAGPGLRAKFSRSPRIASRNRL